MQVIYLMPLSLNPSFHILLRCWGQDSAHSTSQDQLASCWIPAMRGTQGRLEGRQRGEGPEFRFFLSCQHHSSSSSNWLQPPLPFCTPKPSLLTLLQDTASSWWHSFLQLLSTLNPCSECLGFKWAPTFSFPPLALGRYVLPAVTISESPLCSLFALSASQHLCSQFPVFNSLCLKALCDV